MQFDLQCYYCNYFLRERVFPIYSQNEYSKYSVLPFFSSPDKNKNFLEWLID